MSSRNPSPTIFSIPNSNSSPNFPLFPGSPKLCTAWNDQTPVEEMGPLLPPKDRPRHRPPPLQFDKTSSIYPEEQYSLGGTTSVSDRPFLEHTPSPNSHSYGSSHRPMRFFGPRHPFSDQYESPHWFQLTLFTILTLLAYPALYVITIAAQDKPLFWTRLIVGGACGIVGLTLGISLIELARRVLEATTWATVIHLSTSGERSGIPLRKFAHRTDYLSFTWISCKLLFDRMTHSSIRRSARPYDPRPWSLFVLLFLVTAVAAASLTFAFGRIITISTRDVRQRDRYQEVIVIGDLSPDDVARATSQVGAFTDFVRTWTLTPFNGGTTNPQPVRLQYGSEVVYVAETYPAQLWGGGKGLGTFELNATDSGPSTIPSKVNLDPDVGGAGLWAGGLMRWPRWGIRIRCEKLPDPSRNLVPLSEANMTYAFVPRNTLSLLFASLALPFPDGLNKPLNATNLLTAGDTLPASIDIHTIAWGAKFWDNGVAQSFRSSPADNSQGAGGQGWVQLEMVMIRLNSSYTPLGSFGSYGPKTGPDGSKIGYDAAVCVEAFEPWILENFNSTIGAPVTLSVVRKGDQLEVDGEGTRERDRISDVQRSLNSSGKWDAFVSAHDNARNQILKDNGRDFNYVPSPTLLSFTDGQGPSGYTSLDASQVSNSLALADASFFLPYLVGSQPIVAHMYSDDTLATAEVQVVPCVLTLLFILALGYTCAFMVPKLPLGFPRRDFGLFSWLAAFEGDNLAGPDMRLQKHMSIEEIDERLGHVSVRYGPS